jgi:misacylated tRNA(Ala) deacylase
MRMHTAAYIISQIIHQDTRAMITGNQLDVDRSRIDFSIEKFDRDKLKSYEDKANAVVKKGIEVQKISFVDFVNKGKNNRRIYKSS